MIRALLIFLMISLALGGCAGPKRLPPVGSEPIPESKPRPGVPLLIGVGLLEEAPRIEVRATGPCLVLDGDTGRRLSRWTDAMDPVLCIREGNSVNWRCGGEVGTAPSVVLQPVDPETLVGHDESEYRGEFLVLPAPRGGGLTLVNNVELESYLQGVVPWEIGRHDRSRLAALKAQAVAARTYTVAHLGIRRSHGFDVYASVMDQVYRGAAGEDALCNEAVRQTAGLVLRSGGEEIGAFYSACCGGVSSQVEEVWARDARPYLVSRADRVGGRGKAFCADSRYFNWRETWSPDRLEEILGETLPAYLDYVGEGGRGQWAGQSFAPRSGNSDPRGPGRLRDLEILERTTSGRVARLAVETDAGTYYVRGDRTRWVLRPAGGNPAILRSALFEVELVHRDGQLAEISIRGKGYGHGIGLCQTGALEMARQGFTFRAILSHYYQGALLTDITGSTDDD